MHSRARVTALLLAASGAFGCSDDPTNADAASDCSDATCLPRDAATWPMPNPGTLGLPNPARFEAEPELARDLLTGLEFSLSFAPLSSYAGAVSYCETLELAGHADFRVPSRIELVSLLDRTRTPAIDARVFDETPLDYFWSSTELPENPGFRYSVYFGAGETSSGDETQASAYVRCVRAGIRRAAPRYRSGDGVSEDLGTGLVWQSAASETPLSRAAAEAYCAPDGNGAWRLPSDKELQTLLTTAASPSGALIDGDVFPDTPPADFWTLTFEPVAPLFVSFVTGFATVTDGAGLAYARCVR
jgi:hypothetical protein